MDFALCFCKSALRAFLALESVRFDELCVTQGAVWLAARFALALEACLKLRQSFSSYYLFDSWVHTPRSGQIN